MTRLVQRTISFPCATKHLHDVRKLVEETLADSRISEDKRKLIVLAVDETVSSITRYARFKGYDHQISIAVDVDEVRFKAVVIDEINVFDLLEGLSNKELAQHAATERSYTLGLFLVRKIMDEITYTYKKGFENTLELVHFL